MSLNGAAAPDLLPGIADQHVHPENGPYEPGTYPLSWFQAYVDTAHRRGIASIGLVEHAYRFREAFGLLDVPWADARCRYTLDQYDQHRTELRAHALPFRFGLEVDHVPGKTDAIRRFVERREWDFLLGSVHWLGDFPIDLDPAYWEGRRPDDVWEAYTAAVEDLCRSRIYDVLTHPDLPKLFGHRPTRDPHDWYARIADALAEADMAIEINTKGLRRPVHALYPAAEFLAEAKARGVPLSLGSDAHEPEHVGEQFEAAYDLARQVGYETMIVFVGRRRIAQALPSRIQRESRL